MVQAPQLDVSQPTWVPVSPRSSRMAWTSSRRGSTSIVRGSPLTVRLTEWVLMPLLPLTMTNPAIICRGGGALQRRGGLRGGSVSPVRNPWLGLDSSADPVGLARLLMRAHERALAGGGDEEILRDVVTRSWRRSRLAGVDPDHHEAPLLHDRRDIAERWRTHPLSRFAPLVRETLSDFAYDARHIVVIADADGCLLWSSGHPSVLAASEDIGFVPGRLWRE